MIVLIGIVFISIIVNRFFTQTQFIIFLCLLAFILRLAWVLTVHTNIVQDFAQMYNGAVDAQITISHSQTKHTLLLGYIS